MTEKLVLSIYVIALYAGYLLPIPMLVLAWGEWINAKRIAPSRHWRRNISWAGLLLLTFELAFAIAILLAEGTAALSRQVYYDSWAMYAGGLGAMITIGASLLAESRLRRFLLLGAIGMACLFWLGLVEPI
jgi:hypothetical protein